MPPLQLRANTHLALLRLSLTKLTVAFVRGDGAIRNQQLDRPPDQLIRRIAKQRLHRPARYPDHALGVDEEHRVRQARQQRRCMRRRERLDHVVVHRLHPVCRHRQPPTRAK